MQAPVAGGARPVVYQTDHDLEFSELKKSTTWEYVVHPDASHLNVLPDGTTIEMANLIAEGTLDGYDADERTKFIAESRTSAMLDTELDTISSNISREVLRAFQQPLPSDPNEQVPLLRGDAHHFAPLSSQAATAAGYRFTSKERCPPTARKMLDGLLKTTGTRGQQILQMQAAIVTGLYAQIDAGLLATKEDQLTAFRRAVHRLSKLTVDMHLGVQRNIMSTMFELPKSDTLVKKPQASALSWAAAARHDAKRQELSSALISVSKPLRKPGTGGGKTDSHKKSDSKKQAGVRFKLKTTPSRIRGRKGKGKATATDSEDEDDDSSDADKSSSQPTHRNLNRKSTDGVRTKLNYGGKPDELGKPKTPTTPKLQGIGKGKGKGSVKRGGANSDTKQHQQQQPLSRKSAMLKLKRSASGASGARAPGKKRKLGGTQRTKGGKGKHKSAGEHGAKSGQ
jgi:hypothetical protein